MAAAKKPKYKIARDTVVTSGDGRRVLITRGDTYLASDPLVKRLKGVFVDPDEYARLTGVMVEQATAAPGEVRNVSKPKEEG